MKKKTNHSNQAAVESEVQWTGLMRKVRVFCRT